MGRLDFSMPLDLGKLVLILVTLATENDASANQGLRSDPCPFGYVLNAGSISKSGQLGLQKNVESIDDCKTLCNEKEYCCAFEYSDSKKWCFLNVDCNPTRGAYKDFDYCMKEAGEVKCVTISGDRHKPCVFPVLWKGESQYKCIEQESTGETWCATETKENGKWKSWGHCGDSCPREGYPPPPPPPPIPTSQCFFPEFAEDEFCNDLNNTPECNYDGGACCGDNVKKTHCIACECLGSSCSLDRTEDENIGYGIDNFQPSSRANPDPKNLKDFTSDFHRNHFLESIAWFKLKNWFENDNQKDKELAAFQFMRLVYSRRGTCHSLPPKQTFIRMPPGAIIFFRDSEFNENKIMMDFYTTENDLELLEINTNIPLDSRGFFVARIKFGAQMRMPAGTHVFCADMISHFVRAI